MYHNFKHNCRQNWWSKVAGGQGGIINEKSSLVIWQLEVSPSHSLIFCSHCSCSIIPKPFLPSPTLPPPPFPKKKNWAEKAHESRNSPTPTPATPASQVFCQAKTRQIFSAKPVLSSLRKSNATVMYTVFFQGLSPTSKQAHIRSDRGTRRYIHPPSSNAKCAVPQPANPSPPFFDVASLHRRKTPITPRTNYDR